MTTPRLVALVATGAVLTLALAGCSYTENPISAIPPVAGTEMGVEMGADMGSGMMSSDTKSATEVSSSDVTTEIEPMTIETAYMSISVTSPESDMEKATELVKSVGGFVQDSSWNPANEFGPESVYMTLRVPAAQLDNVIATLQDFGAVDSLSRSSSDVTLAITDLDARIVSLESSLEALRVLQDQATTVADLIAVESAIAQRQSELDGLLAQQTFLTDQVNLSTIGLTFTGTAGGTPTNQSFWDGLVAGWNSLGVVAAGFLVVLGFALPWIVLIALVAAIVLVIVLALVRRARNAHAAGPTARAKSSPKPGTKARPKA